MIQLLLLQLRVQVQVVAQEGQALAAEGQLLPAGQQEGLHVLVCLSVARQLLLLLSPEGRRWLRVQA